MSAAEGSGDQKEEKTAPPGATANGKSQNPASLEDELRELNRLIKGSDWLEKNTADMWLEANPDAVEGLKFILDQRAANQKQSQSSSEMSESKTSSDSQMPTNSSSQSSSEMSESKTSSDSQMPTNSSSSESTEKQ